jgi:hypothetical protein
MSKRPNSLPRTEIVEALNAPSLFVSLRDYFGSPEEDAMCRTFECAMEFDPSLGRIELYFFNAWQEGGDEPLFHLIARSQRDNSVSPSVLTIEGQSYNARHLERETFRTLLKFVGEVRQVCGDDIYRDNLARFHNVLKPALLAELKSSQPAFTDPQSIFHWGEHAILSPL